jgi:S-adenosylmethionine uptake transporter
VLCWQPAGFKQTVLNWYIDVIMSSDPLSPVIPFGIATIGIATFAGMDAIMKGLSIGMGAYNAMLWRTSIALLIAIALFLWQRTRWPQLRIIRLHVWRGVVTSLMAFLFFWGLAYVPLAEAIGLSFIAPLIALYLAAVLLGERIGDRAVLASVIGFAGAMVIVGGRFSGEYGDDVARGIVAILLSAVLYAYNLILQRQQALVAEPVEIAFFQNATMLSVYLCLAPWLAVVPGLHLLPSLVGAAVLGMTSLLLLSWAYARAEANILIPVEYTAFVWAVLFGWLVFAETVTVATLGGTALIVVGCFIAARQKSGPVEHVETTAV